MSDDLEARGHYAITHDGETYIKLADVADTFKRLRLCRTAINDALTNWLDPLLDDEAPKDALRRLIRYEITAALDPAVSQDAANLVATARREGLEEAAKIADRCTPRGHEGYDGAYNRGINTGTMQAKADIAAAIRAAAKEGK